jgi:hypothetical protein
MRKCRPYPKEGQRNRSRHDRAGVAVSDRITLTLGGVRHVTLNTSAGLATRAAVTRGVADGR